MDPANTNLLNSLGETYAQMNKPRKAKPYLEAGLRIDSRHYMALPNLGVASLTIAEDEKAIAYFEQTLTVQRHKPGISQTNDLLLQLTRLYCRTGRYKKTVALLGKKDIFAESGADFPVRFAILRYLGEAYIGNREKQKKLS